MDFAREVTAAARRIAPHVRETPVEPAPSFGGAGCRVWFKLENLQRTGSFKLRGALNKLLTLGDAERGRGVVAASSGNHGAGVACAARTLGCRAIVFVPTTAPEHKTTAIAALGAEVRAAGDDCLITETTARAWAAENGMAYVSPYNDAAVIAGQGTVGEELDRQLDDLDAVYVAVGGGGLVAGVGGYLRSRRPDIEVVACSPERSPALHAALQAGRVVDVRCQATLSDATAGGMEADSVTLDLCRRVVDRSVLVTEDEIAAALRAVVARHHTLIEGAAAVAVAALAKDAGRLAGKDVAVILCGANIGLDTLRAVL